MSRLRYSTAAGRDLRRRIFQRDDFTCGRCGWSPPGLTQEQKSAYDGATHLPCEMEPRLRFLQIDHIIPRSAGGALRDESNLQTLCSRCNESKGIRPQWAEEVAA